MSPLFLTLGYGIMKAFPPDMNTAKSRQNEIKSLTTFVAKCVSRLTGERSTMTEEEAALVSARANEAALRLMLLIDEQG